MNTPAPIRFLHWSILFSPLRDDEMAHESWQALELPGTFADSTHAFTQHFFMDLPAPKASLLLSVLLQREGGSCREEWMRIAQHLDMRREGPSLPPDHLALACEVLAHAINRQESLLVDGIADRYLLPWTAAALDACEDDTLRILLERFAQDVAVQKQSAAA